jgi:hypothetical protein
LCQASACRSGTEVRAVGRLNELAVQGVVVAAVLELLADAAADLEAQVRGDRHVAGVEQAVDVASEQQAVLGRVLAALAVGADVRRVQGRQRPLRAIAECCG